MNKNMRNDNDLFLDWLEERRLEDQGYTFHETKKASYEDEGMRRERMRVIEQVIERL